MFGSKSRPKADATAVLDAIGRSLAFIEFDPQGMILHANEAFCDAMGYALSEIQGHHHSMFVEPDHARSPDYKAFWARLGMGEPDQSEAKRFGKGGKEVWIKASYNPVRNAKGALVKVVAVATVVTESKLQHAEFEGRIAAVSRVQATIEFTPDGEVLTANDNFLALMGYRLDEVQGQHHRLFVEPTYARSSEYQEFWASLNRGEHTAMSFKRFGKGGKEVWIQASYNPLVDLDGRVVKIVKFATDMTDLNEIGAGLAALARSDLEYRIDTPFLPTFEKLRLDYMAAHDTLRSTLESVADSAEVIMAGTNDMSTASADLSRRTEQQAASLEETAAALNQITVTVKKAAEGADHARQVVLAADNDAKQTAVVVRKAVEAMDVISQSATQINQIIGVIDEIAFQTNLLALNAGVEAARAGDAGRGFAVVASEVRALAQRSAEAAKEIKGLISTSSTQVAQGVELVAQTGKSLERIMTQVTEINSVVATIAAGAKEQSIGLEEVNVAINQMDQVTQKNAAMVEESAAASQSLAQETGQLSDLVARFRLGPTAGGTAMRRELEKVAPHAFGLLPKTVERDRPRVAVTRIGLPSATTTIGKVSARAEPAAVKVAMVQASSSGDSAGWEEF